LRGHRGGIGALAFARDGKTLVSGGWETAALVWRLPDEGAKPVGGPLGEAGLHRAWADLAGEDAGRAHRAVWALAAVPEEAVPFLRDRLRPVAVVDEKQLRRWIAELDGDEFETRQRATRELKRLGGQAEAAVTGALKGTPSVEARRRLESILRKLQGGPGPEELRELRAVQALERIGSPQARAILRALARGAPVARQTQEAKEALERLAR
jgi:hypothetical protein